MTRDRCAVRFCPSRCCIRCRRCGHAAAPRFANVFTLGVEAGLPTSRTAWAVRYDGYTVCPLITGYGSVVMVEFDYSQQPISSFLFDPTKERWRMWLMKTRLLPWLYWNRMLPGLPHEGRYLRPLAPLAHALWLNYRQAAQTEEGMPSDCC
jgi:sulfide:quinone oxidoreductase